MALTYVLEGGDLGAQRLRVLSQALLPFTRKFFSKLNLRPGMKCLDVGCGSGEVTCEIAKQVGSAGQVTGIDLDEKILEHAKRNAEAQNLKIQFQQADVSKLKLAKDFDFIYGRFILSHLKNPVAIIQNLKSSLKAGGLLAIEDTNMDGHISQPACKAFQRYIEIYKSVVQMKGADSLIGPKLEPYFSQAGFSGIQVNVELPLFSSGEGKSIAALTLQGSRSAVLEHKIASDKEIETLLLELKHFEADPKTTMSTAQIFQVWARV